MEHGWSNEDPLLDEEDTQSVHAEQISNRG
jgi:hypothetical protein